MNKQGKIILIGMLILVAAVMIYFFSGSKAPKSVRPTFVSADWKSKYQLNEKTPYGLSFFNELLEVHLDSTQKIHTASDAKQLDSLLEKQVVMVFIGEEFGLQNEEIDSVIKGVENGSTLFLSFNSLTSNILERLFVKVDIRYDYADSVNVFAGKNKYTQYQLFQNDTIAYQWSAFYEVIPTDSVYKSLSSFMEMSNFIEIPKGKGKILLQTNPNFYFNYQIKRDDGFRYAEHTLNQLSKNKDIVHLELGRLLAESDEIMESLPDEEGEGKQDDSYLQFLLTSPAFIAAMALTVFGIFLFLLFRARRLRPIVPYIGPKKNMSLEFANTITSIYLSRQYPFSLLQLQKKNFYDTVYKFYYIDLSKNLDNREKDLFILTEKSNYPYKDLSDLFKLLETKVWALVDDNYLVDVAKKMRVFYESTGIISAKVLDKISVIQSKFQRELLVSVGCILIGISMIIVGFYFLVVSLGIGIIFWPLGLSLLLFGIVRLNKPLLSISGNEITHYPIIGKSRKYNLKEIYNVIEHTNSVEIHFNGGKQLLINYWEMSRFDKKQFKQFISVKH